MASLPSPNQIDDHRQHLELMQRAEAAAKRGHELMKKGDRTGAHAALDEADELVERADLLAERWKR